MRCLANLMLLCTQHHRLVHEGGFRIEKDYRDRWFFRRPDGRAVPACGYRAADMTDDEIDTVDEAIKAYLAGADAIHTSAEVSTVREPSAEVYTAAASFREGWMPGQSMSPAAWRDSAA